MKILVINLLRIGDFLQAAPVLDGLTKRYPVAQVDVLCFGGTERLAELTPFVRRWWTLDRTELQEGLGRADVPLMTSFDVLGEQLAEISAERYDLVINLTHTAFSGYVNGLIRAREKLGLELLSGGRALFHSPWFRYLDEHAQRPGTDVFHHADVFWQACGLDGVPKTFALARTAGGRAEVDALGLDERPLVIVQPFTSDERKTYPAARLTAALTELTRLAPSSQIVLLAAPDEAVRAEALAATVGARVAVTSLSGALSLLDRARVLITGDTSIKHLAMFTDARVLELSLGPSDYRRTGAFKPGGYVLQSRAACAPCGHSAGCNQSRQRCADEIEPALVARVADALLRGGDDAIRTLAQGTATTQVLRTRELETGFWYAVDVATGLTAAELATILGRCTWKFWLNQEHRVPCAAYGSEAVRLERELTALWPGARAPLLAHLDVLERASDVPPPAATASEFTSRRRADLARARATDHRDIKAKLIRSLKHRLTESP